MPKDFESFPRPDLRARAGLPAIDDRLRTPPPPRFRKVLIVGLIFLAVIVLVVAGFKYFRWTQPQAPAQTRDHAADISAIPTPKGWYSWGGNHYPDYESGTINAVTFADQPINNTGNNTTTLINVHTQVYPGQTDEQLITDVLYPSLAQLEAPTSSMIWSVINGRLALQAITGTPGGGWNFNEYVLDNGVVYSFTLGPSYLVAEYKDVDLADSPDGQVMKIMVQNFANSLPALKPEK